MKGAVFLFVTALATIPTGAHAEAGSERVDRRSQFERVAIARAALHQLGGKVREAGPIRPH